jgi:hypothetical protein
MNPKLKAKDLVEQYLLEVRWKLTQKDCLKRAKNCALIAVDEILKNNKILFEDVLNEQYWQEVKQEIELL